MGFAGWIKRRHASALLLLTAATCAMAARTLRDRPFATVARWPI